MMFPEIGTAFEDVDLTPAIASASSQTTAAASGDLPSWFEVSQLASETVGAAGVMLARLAGRPETETNAIHVDRRLASLWFGYSARPVGWSLPPTWDDIAGDYRSSDGWMRLHTNAPHHRAAALRALKLAPDATRDDVTAAVAQWRATELEAAVVAERGCAAEMRSIEDWANHPQGMAVAQEPLIAWHEHGVVTARGPAGSAERPLTGLRVLDLTRVLAGPVSTRFLAAFGADVLRIDPPFWKETSLEPEMTVGKCCAGLDLSQAGDRDTFLELASTADILIHGYRSDALPGLGLDMATLRRRNPALVDVALCAYGWTGPWATRRGFDSLVQMSSGIAAYGMAKAGAERPQPLPVQALDHATGYLMAAAALHALEQRRTSGRVLSARLSLARTGRLLATSKRDSLSTPFRDETDADLSPDLEETVWGPLRRLRFPVSVTGLAPGWTYPAGPLRARPALWTDRAA